MDDDDFDPIDPYDALVEAHQRIQRLEQNQAYLARALETSIQQIRQHQTELNRLAVEIQTDRLTNLTRLYPAPSDETKRMRPWWHRWFK
jgi:uncharacterized coiled-coil protein SlyX